jgi:hypothetical protein
MLGKLSSRVERLARSTLGRLLVAVVLVAWHVATMISFAAERFDVKAFDSSPNQPPAFVDEAHDDSPARARRLLVTRWDALHYLGLAMRGYVHCPPGRPKSPDATGCQLGFYPGYPVLGWIVASITHLGTDYALWTVSLVAAVASLFLWTDPVIVSAIGLRATYATLLLFNFFPPAVYLVLIMTEACTVLGVLAAFVFLARRRYALAAVFAGFAGAMRISGMCAECAFFAGLAVACWFDPPRRIVGWLGRAALIPLGAWGTIAVNGYHWYRFGDPLLYIHAHAAAHGHKGGLNLLLHARPELIIHAMDTPEHQLVWAGALFLVFIGASRLALRHFNPAAQVYAYSVVVLVYVISMAGTIDLYYMGGLSRYVLAATPAFLAAGVALAPRPLLLAVVLYCSAWHSRELDLCYYLGDVGPNGLRKCNASQWIDYRG